MAVTTAVSRSDQLCRITVVAGSRYSDVAIPVDLPLVALIPGLAARCGDKALTTQGAVLQRWGEGPLDENRTATMLGLVDGETLFLQPRQDDIPSMQFDDIVDAITSTTGQPASLWRRTVTIRLFRAVAVALLLMALVMIMLPGPAASRQLATDLAAVISAAIAIAAARGFGDRPTSLVFSAAAVAYASVLGAVGDPASSGSVGASVAALATPQAALTSGLAVMILSALLVVAVGDFIPLLFPAALLGALLTIFGVMAAAFGGGVRTATAVLLVFSLGFMISVPMIAFRLARMQLPSLPESVEDMSVGIEPLRGGAIVRQVMLADRAVIGMHCVLAATIAIAMTIFFRTDGVLSFLLLGLTGGLVLLRSRLLRGVAQRLPLLVLGAFTMGLLVIRTSAFLPPDARALLTVLLALALAAAVLFSSAWVASQKPAPYLGRAAELLEWICGAAILPIAAGLCGVFGWAHGLVG